jgi:hypothetical protein
MPFEKKQRDHLAKQSLMKESITDALQKTKGGNCVRSYASLAKVRTTQFIYSCFCYISYGRNEYCITCL